MALELERSQYFLPAVIIVRGGVPETSVNSTDGVPGGPFGNAASGAAILSARDDGLAIEDQLTCGGRFCRPTWPPGSRATGG